MSPRSSPRPTRLDWVRQFGGGDLIAVSALQPGMRWFETSFGAWPYVRVAGMDLSLGGPLCAREDRPEMIRRFLARSRRPILFYLREDLLHELDGAGLYAAGIGVDRHVDARALLGAPQRPVRGALKKARKAGLRLRELDLDRLDPPTRAKLEAADAAYLARARVKVEMRFLNRPMSWRGDGLRRVFALEKFDAEHQGIFGYAVLNPVFDRGEPRAYLLDILRFEPTRLWGVWLSSVVLLTERLAREGLQLSVGFCPLHGVRPAPASASPILQRQIDWMVDALAEVHYIRRLRELKSLIPGPAEPRYLASFSRLAPVWLYAFLEAMGVGLRVLWSPRTLELARRALTVHATR